MADLKTQIFIKLWDNINNKDARVWTFFSFYGATLALFFGSNTSLEVRILGLPVMFLISVWTIELVLSAEWWLARNQLMIARLEITEEEDLKGIVPRYYQYPGYRVETVMRFSLFVLSLITLFIFIYANFLLGSYVPVTAKDDQGQLLGKLVGLVRPALLVGLDCAAIFAITYCVAKRERQINDYWRLVAEFQKEHLKDEAGVKAVQTDSGKLTDEKLKSRWGSDRVTFSLRWGALLYIGMVFSAIIFLLFRATTDTGTPNHYVVLALFAIGLIAFIVARSQYNAWTKQSLSIEHSNLSDFAVSGLVQRGRPIFQRLTGSIFYLASLAGVVLANFPGILRGLTFCP